MKLAIFTTFAFPIAFTEAAGVRYGAIPPELIGAEQLPFGDFVAAPCEGCAPNYCYPKYEDPDYECYKEGYPKCCSKNKGNCPNNKQPKCECEDQGGCTKGNTGTKDVRCSRNDGTCKGEDFCNISNAASRFDCEAQNTGRCEAMPVSCSRDLRRVCGCNGKTYDNECEANSVGVSVDYDGRC